jgi:hypothetical protein
MFWNEPLLLIIAAAAAAAAAPMILPAQLHSD